MANGDKVGQHWPRLTFSFDLTVAEVEEKVKGGVGRDQEVIRVHQNRKPLKHILWKKYSEFLL